ncbi:MAG: hypothetical protein N2F24_02380, partial [Deltaproteobacteria bacterium]
MTTDGRQPPSHLLECMLENDPYLQPYAHVLEHRLENIRKVEERLIRNTEDLSEFAAGHEYFGLHFRGREWIFREWAPHADAIYLVGDMTDWQERKGFAL